MLIKTLTLLLVNLILIHCDDDDLNIYDQTSGPTSHSACGNENTIDDVAFIKMGTYRKLLINITGVRERRFEVNEPQFFEKKI